ncbi:MAG: hypothetical protein TECD_00946 [Hyphomicrobiaceae bacterium hypho_1]
MSENEEDGYKLDYAGDEDQSNDHLERLHNKILSLNKPYLRPSPSMFSRSADSSELKKHGSMLPTLVEAKRRHVEEDRKRRLESNKCEEHTISKMCHINTSDYSLKSKKNYGERVKTPVIETKEFVQQKDLSSGSCISSRHTFNAGEWSESGNKLSQFALYVFGSKEASVEITTSNKSKESSNISNSITKSQINQDRYRK